MLIIKIKPFKGKSLDQAIIEIICMTTALQITQFRYEQEHLEIICMTTS